MSRITVSQLKSATVSELSKAEMGGTVGGLLFPPRRRFCFPVLRFITVRGPFGIRIRVPRIVLVCR